MSLVQPPALRAGDTIAVVSLSAGVSAATPHRHDAGKRQLAEAFDVQVVDAPHAVADDAYLRANPKTRAEALHWALRNDDIAGIVATIGGDDSIRTVPFLDLDLIREHPKVFLGFSDTTVQHLANRAAGIVSFYGPPDDAWDGAILALETSEEAPPPALVGYWLQNYAATGVLGRIGALLLSRPEYYRLADMFRLWDTVQRVLAESGRPDLPVVANLDYGHSSPMGVLPLGCRTRVDPIARTITVLEAGVS